MHTGLITQVMEPPKENIPFKFIFKLYSMLQVMLTVIIGCMYSTQQALYVQLTYIVRTLYELYVQCTYSAGWAVTKVLPNIVLIYDNQISIHISYPFRKNVYYPRDRPPLLYLLKRL